MPELRTTQTYQKAKTLAQEYLGSDLELDFDMLINKPPDTHTETPWHQDAAYWIDLPDKRALSFWIALDDTTLENGCMWFHPKLWDFLLPHKRKDESGPLYLENPETCNAKAICLKVGDCTLHDGYTLHYSTGNKTQGQRRGLILNYRPKAMILLERQKGFDHT